jgi:hypothetical protein
MFNADNQKDGITMIGVDHIASVKWTPELGEKLQVLRGKVSRRELDEKTTVLGLRVAASYIQQIEQPERQLTRLKQPYVNVSWDVVMIICKALNIDYSELFDFSITLKKSS